MDTESTEIPAEPEKSGADLTQRQPTEEEVYVLTRSPNAGGIVEFPISDALGRVSEHGVRGQAGMVLLLAHVRNVEGQLVQLRRERDEALKRLDKSQEKLYECKRIISVLKERFRSFSRISFLKSIFRSLGALVLGVSVPIAIEKQSLAPISVTVLGLVLSLFGWLFFPAAPKTAPKDARKGA